jgi:multiple sugar transport system ATP-binding protein
VAWVAIQNLTKHFQVAKGEQVRAVDDLTLAVEERELMVLVGPSGCGKTTTLRLIAGLDAPTAGSISIAGRPMNGVRAKDRDVAMVFQNHALYPHMTAWENLAFGLQLRKFPKQEVLQRVGEAAELLGLTSCLKRRPEDLSGGERQRVALGRAIVRKPTLFLFDEPLSHLDGPLRTEMRTEIARLHRQFQWTMIYVTHDQSEAMMLGHRMAVMAAGKLQQLAQPLAVYRTPANLFTAGFIGSPAMNLLKGKLSESGGKRFFLGTGITLELPKSETNSAGIPLGEPMVLGIRPENILIHTQGSSSANSQKLEATVELVEPLGSETHLHLRLGECRLVSRVAGSGHWTPGQPVFLTVSLEPLLLFDPETPTASTVSK